MNKKLTIGLTLAFLLLVTSFAHSTILFCGKNKVEVDLNYVKWTKEQMQLVYYKKEPVGLEITTWIASDNKEHTGEHVDELICTSVENYAKITRKLNRKR